MVVDTLRQLSQFDLKAIDPFFKLALAGINRNSPHGLRQINQLSADIFRDSPLFQGTRQILGSDQEDRVLQAVLTQKFPSYEASSLQEYGALLAAASTRQTIARQLIVQSLNQGVTFGLQPFEQHVLRTACRVAGRFDELGILWTTDVAFNPNDLKASEQGLKNPYTIIKPDKDGYKEVPWATKYPEQIGSITNAFYRLRRRLVSEGGDEAVALAAYFELYNKALRQKDPSALESSWEQVDLKWFDVMGRVQPSDNIGRQIPSGFKGIPAFNLTVDMEHPEYVEPLDRTKRVMAKHLRSRYGGLSSFQKSVEYLENNQVRVAVNAVTAGSLDLMFAGFNNRTPNGERAKIFIIPEIVTKRFEEAKELAAKVFKTESDRKLFDQIDVPLTVIGTTFGGHEFGHGLFLGKETKKALGEQTTHDLEEDLGDLTIAGVMRDAVRKGDLPKQSLLHHVARNLTFCLRILSQGKSTQLRSYDKNISSWLRRMTESGFITRNDDGWYINPEATDKLYDLVEEDLEQLVQVAETKDKNLAAAYLAKTTETPAIQDLLDTVLQVARKF